MKQAVEKKAQETRVAAAGAHNDPKLRIKAVARHMITDVQKGEGKLFDKAGAIAKFQEDQFVTALQDLVRKAEVALGKEETTPTSSDRAVSPEINSDTQDTDKNLYTAPLPLGFEPPPGFFRPTPPKKEAPKAEPSPAPLPLIAPSVSSLSASEPIIAHLAGTIDNLASYLASNPTAASKAADVLETAKVDLTALADRIEKVKDEERVQLEQKLDEQTREYTLKLMELEMEAQDKLDSQEEGFRKYFDEERIKFVQSYREKLDRELRTQTELINER
jgi:mitofilin